MAVPAWWMSTSPVFTFNPFSIACESSELDRFLMAIFGNIARKSNKRLVSLLEPVILMLDFIRVLEGGDKCSFNPVVFLVN